MKITKELVINALLAGLWAALAAFSTTQDFSTSALFAAAAVGVRAVVGALALSVPKVPAIPVDE